MGTDPPIASGAARRRLRTGIRMLLVVCLMRANLFASEPETGETEERAKETESKIKVAYVYNFLKFVEWPEDEKNATAVPFRVCLIGTDPIRTMLGELSIRRIKERPIEVVYLKDSTALASCHLLYISRSEGLDLPRILQRLQGAPVLSVSDIPQFAPKGGMVGFVTEANRVRIEINLRQVRKARLKVSAKLLEIARIVQ